MFEQQTKIVSFHHQIIAIKLYKNSYNDWRKKMLRILKRIELDGFVRGSIKCPRKTNAKGNINGSQCYWLR